MKHSDVVSKQMLANLNACKEGIKQFENQFSDTEPTVADVIEFLKAEKLYSDLSWLYENLKFTGSYKTYYSDGKVYAEGTYKNGLDDGPFKSYYENGQVDVVCNYKDGKREGPFKRHYESGEVHIECAHKNGKLEGPYKRCWDNGFVEVECAFKNGELVFN